jgi:hypothetical protein
MRFLLFVERAKYCIGLYKICGTQLGSYFYVTMIYDNFTSHDKAHLKAKLFTSSQSPSQRKLTVGVNCLFHIVFDIYDRSNEVYEDGD